MLPMLWPTEMRNACGNWLRFNNGEDATPKQFTYNTLSRALISLNTFLARAFCSLPWIRCSKSYCRQVHFQMELLDQEIGRFYTSRRVLRQIDWNNLRLQPEPCGTIANGPVLPWAAHPNLS